MFHVKRDVPFHVKQLPENMKQTKKSISDVIYDPERTHVLLVKRPEDDKDLPSTWGLPAGSVKNGETYEESVLRSGKEKLGVSLEIIELIEEGEVERKDYILHMKEYEAKITKGEPEVPQQVEGITQYQDWKWGVWDELKETAQKGSLCCQLYLQSINQK